MHPEKLKNLALAVLDNEADAVRALKARIDDSFVDACRILLGCSGRIVVTGMGKSGHIGDKIAATLASTGSPSFFMHPGEASHGDLGMIVAGDAVLALSNSGETAELLTILPLIKRMGIPMVAMTGKTDSTLAQSADVHLDVSVAQEACPLNLAPTSSTTAALAMGDALAVALLEQRGFTAEDFARSHPGGSLGRRLLVHVEDIMHTGDAMPQAHPGDRISDALVTMTQKGLGMVLVVDHDEYLQGLFTDGDLRRCIDRQHNIHSMTLGEAMTRNFSTVHTHMLAAEGLKLMQTYKINALPVLNDDDKVAGVFNMHDLLRAGVV